MKLIQTRTVGNIHRPLDSGKVWPFSSPHWMGGEFLLSAEGANKEGRQDSLPAQYLRALSPGKYTTFELGLYSTPRIQTPTKRKVIEVVG